MGKKYKDPIQNIHRKLEKPSRVSIEMNKDQY